VLRGLLISVVALSIAACAQGPRPPTRVQVFDTAAKQCQDTHTTPTVTAQCINAAEERAYAGDGLDDLHRLRTTQRLMLASKIERHEITPEEGAAEYAKIDAYVRSEAERRAYDATSLGLQAATASQIAQQAQAANMAHSMCQLSGQCW
jgi:hypothetical protein